MLINYTQLTEKALLQGVVVPIIKQLAQKYVPNQIFVAFKPSNVSTSLRALFKDKITISFENYESLSANENSFTICSYFATGLETICVPFDSILQFMDKENRFALEFKSEKPISPDQPSFTFIK